jgi:hypothetical protein
LEETGQADESGSVSQARCLDHARAAKKGQCTLCPPGLAGRNHDLWMNVVDLIAFRTLLYSIHLSASFSRSLVSRHFDLIGQAKSPQYKVTPSVQK